MTTKRAAEPTEFDHAWERVTRGGGAIVRAAVALLEGYGGRRA